MNYEIIKKAPSLKVRDLREGEYFRFKQEGDSINDNTTSIYLVVKNGDNTNKEKDLLAIDLYENLSFSLQDDLDLEVVKLKLVKFENDIFYFEEI